MMMPANYSAIAENEMTYVNGGADIWAPLMGEDQWKQFVANQVTLIGNSFMAGFLGNTIGKVFSGNYVPGDIVTGWTEKHAYEKVNGNVDAAFNGNAWAYFAKSWGKTTLNNVLNIVGNAAAIYNLATKETKIGLPTTF